jgi:hypothetical protein
MIVFVLVCKGKMLLSILIPSVIYVHSSQLIGHVVTHLIPLFNIVIARY